MKRFILLSAVCLMSVCCVSYGNYDTNTEPYLYVRLTDASSAVADEPAAGDRSAAERGESLRQIRIPESPGLVEVVGHIKVEILYLHPLFVSIPTRQRDVLRRAALRKAETRYGEEPGTMLLCEPGVIEQLGPLDYCCLDMQLANIRFEQRWHSLSLLFAGGMFGWVEQARIEAVVVRRLSTREILPTWMIHHAAPPFGY